MSIYKALDGQDISEYKDIKNKLKNYNETL